MFWVDPLSRQPVYEQLIEQTERFILTGVLHPGDQMPSVRSLSLSLTVNPNTIQKAYTELDRRGLLTTVPGKGGFIAARAPEIARESRRSQLPAFDALVRDLRLSGVTQEELTERIHTLYQHQNPNGKDEAP